MRKKSQNFCDNCGRSKNPYTGEQLRLKEVRLANDSRTALYCDDCRKNNNRQLTKPWAEIKEKKTKNLIRIIYNPYGKTRQQILEDWILPECRKDCYVIFTK